MVRDYRPAFLTALVALLLLAPGAARAERAPAVIPTLSRIEAICRHAVPADRIDVAGNAYERGVRRAEHRRRRAEVLAGLYRVDLRPADFGFAEYDVENDELLVDVDGGLRVFGGRAVLAVARDDVLRLRLGPAEAQSLVERHERGHLSLGLTFVLDSDDEHEAPCSSSRRDSDPLRVRIAVAAFELLSRDGTVAAAGRLPRYGDVTAGPSGEETPRGAGGPTVVLSTPSESRRSAGLQDALGGSTGAALRTGALACYRSALRSAEELAGVVVVRMTVAQGGAVQAAHVEIDSVGHPGLATCVLERARSARFPSGAHGTVSAPLLFSND